MDYQCFGPTDELSALKEKTVLDKLGMTIPIIQAPMAGVSTPALAAEVSNAGGLGSIGVGATDAAGARAMIEELRSRTDRAFNVNLFVHGTPTPDPVREAAWLEWLGPLFAEFGAEPPKTLRTIYKSFVDDAEMLSMLLEARPPVISFHFGLPSTEAIRALKANGTTLLATATSPEEARHVEKAGIDVTVAQGIEAGGHRGVFDPSLPDDGLGTFALTRLLVRERTLPVIAAGGIMDGAGIAAALGLGAIAAQLGTAFIACPESNADEAYRKALTGPGAYHTRLTRLISGRPARALANRFTALQETFDRLPPDYPIAYDAGKALHAAAKASNEHGFGAQWAGQGAPLARAMPAAKLISTLVRELEISTAALKAEVQQTVRDQ
ncbi:NAD(P)H-dependent flavin oxidoreductase [Rhizobium leguminosarum]|uniref:NAD(P)H-dependent flavin oxidoreductase n=1 Tax=Rhizobium leguminosarum TaxID=384 RepID=UPI00068436D6|nr:nitronate monooxygenase [Rhizobium leguminosarum]